MQRIKKPIIAVLVLSLLALGGQLLTSLSAQERQGGQRRGEGPGPGPMIERLSETLKLTDEQKAKIKPILEAETTKVRTVFADESLAQDQKMSKVREIRQATRAQIKPILTAEQQKKYEEMPERPGRPGARPEGKPEGGKDKKDPG